MMADHQTLQAASSGKARLRIAIDARCILPQEDGLGTYARNLLRELARLDHPHQLIVLVGTEARRELASLEEPGRFELLETDIPSMKASQHVRLPFVLKRLKPDVYHYLVHDAPVMHRVPTVTTVHDMNYLMFSDYYSKWRLLKQAYSYLVTRLSVGHAKHVMVPSEATRSLLVARWPWVDPRVTVVPYGVHERYQRDCEPEALDAVLEQHGLELERYFLFVGTDRPHKNLHRMVDAFAKLPDTLRSSLRLAVAGAHRYGTSFRSSESLPAGLRILGYVPTEHLPALYRGALAFVMPSLGEGFGLPALEAMTVGSPVIVSRDTSLEEVVGDAGLVVDPTSTESITEAMTAVASDEVLRERLVRSGRKRSRQFSFEETARRALSIYEAIGSKEDVSSPVGVDEDRRFSRPDTKAT